MTSILIKNVLHGTTTTDVLIEGNLITRIAPGISAPEGAEVLDGTDKAIIPRLHQYAYPCVNDALPWLRR